MSEQRERILSLACDLFLSDGADGFSMRKLARAVGVTAPALYKYYESKERLLHDVMTQAYESCSPSACRPKAASISSSPSCAGTRSSNGPMNEASFRAFFQESGMRILEGTGTPEMLEAIRSGSPADAPGPAMV